MVLVGYGRVGQRIADALTAGSIPFVVVEQRREIVKDLRRNGLVAVSGNAVDPAVLIQAHIADAAMVVVATHDPLAMRQMATTARTLSPDIEVLLGMHSEDESSILRKDGVGTVLFGEEELAKGMIDHVLARFAVHKAHPEAVAPVSA